MTRLEVGLFSVLILCSGCNSENANSEKDRARVATQIANDSVADKNDATIQGGDATDTDPAIGDAVSEQELSDAIARHKDTSKWHFGVRPDGYPTGTWLSQDGDKSPLVFEDDGSFKCGFLWKKGAGKYATGRYAISKTGLIVAVARHNGVRVVLFYNIKAGILLGARGPKPRVEWKKTKLAKE